ncbi:hypothetical protein F8388_011026 [Cannabis sativa]|uniref:DUF4283 domain-containing protein n=1 Tax=Cannabis sativa TaxID=3483 RepID=A0A7J6FT77_CANSA|nr:hypothetical protein F8388_011026 [Cannabis sativa]
MSWHAIKGWKCKEIEGGLIQFNFANRDDAMNVLARRPWFVCGALIVIMPWPALLTPAKVKFNKTPIWVNVESIPPFYWNLSNLKELAAKASPVYELPLGIEDAVGMSTLRFRATIDLDSPIFSGFFLRRQRLNDLWIQYRYEKLPEICFKCGILNHDQGSCFKAPTIVKDAHGNYYPMYGVWLKNDAKEKSTFTTPLAKWFQDLVLQKQLGKDPTLRNQFKVHKALQHAENDELREFRLQFPSKRRIVEDSDDAPANTLSNAEAVITQLLLVNLPGIGEFAPFGNNTKKVIIQDLIDATPSNTPIPLTNITISGKLFEKGILQNSPQNHAQKQNELQTIISKEDKEHSDGITLQTNPKKHIQSLGTACTSAPLNESSPFHGIPKPNGPASDDNIQSLPYTSSPLSSQTCVVKWPSSCWAQQKGRELVMGSLMVDKYHREPTIFYPILDVEDFRVDEHLQGPRKRKASDGILFYPTSQANDMAKNKQPSLEESSLYVEIPKHLGPSAKEDIDRPSPTQKNSLNTPPFSPGSHEHTHTPRRRGRPRGKSTAEKNSSEGPKRRGQPPKSGASLSALPKPFKWQNRAKAKKGVAATIHHHWEGKTFDLKVDLDNHFVVIERMGKNCKIISSNKFTISVEINSDPPGYTWTLHGIYGPPRYEDKEVYWLRLGDVVLNDTKPVLLLGDMNGTLHDRECLNYANPGNSSRYAFDFRRMVHRAGLINLGFLGPGYTWAKGTANASRASAMKWARLN